MKAKYEKPTVEILDFCTEAIANGDVDPNDPDFDLDVDLQSMPEW